MKWFVSYFVWHAFPYSNVWTPLHGVIEVHPLKWIRQQPEGFRLTWWKELSAEDEKAFAEV